MMFESAVAVLKMLDDLNIDYILKNHPPVFTNDDEEKINNDENAFRLKNLFVCDKGLKHFFVVVTPHDKRVDLRFLADSLCTRKLQFCTNEQLQQMLQLQNGFVSPFGLVNDASGKIRLLIDKEVQEKPLVRFHPNSNTQSVLLSMASLQRVLEKMEKQITWY